MFAILAPLVFVVALALAMGTMTFMFIAYRDKMVAALLYKPTFELEPSMYHVEVRHSRNPAPVAVRTRIAQIALAA